MGYPRILHKKLMNPKKTFSRDRTTVPQKQQIRFTKATDSGLIPDRVKLNDWDSLFPAPWSASKRDIMKPPPSS